MSALFPSCRRALGGIRAGVLHDGLLLLGERGWLSLTRQCCAVLSFACWVGLSVLACVVGLCWLVFGCVLCVGLLLGGLLLQGWLGYCVVYCAGLCCVGLCWSAVFVLCLCMCAGRSCCVVLCGIAFVFACWVLGCVCVCVVVLG